MPYSLSLKGKEVESKVYFVIFTVNKNISKNDAATYIYNLVYVLLGA